ncbi:NAD(P)/FAD-dependent oxidoreductase [Bosea sp. TND4EK4]|uniref:flavin-containing monooxygenase n=1 Tax=Bosea sp. TND4EK4 TaxID=1907408 RepID=UPI000956EA7F|nr:NAD(P)/FAD-dependent oxidoreductase [Bosea sp. TND4EK4]SIR08714.1 cyclohexanone monooxygenase [Bosea sp. TND4EK4]
MADAGKAGQDFDVAIIGAGFSGLYLIHRLRRMGFSVRAFETASDIGGTWYWNRYPGARCDVESMQYSYSFDEDLQQEWNWSERFATQPEILSYAQHVAERFDLKRDVELDTTIESAVYDQAARSWTLTTDKGAAVSARFCVMATGCLSAARDPEINGAETFGGEVYRTGNWPHRPVDLAGKRVGVIGTGSSAIQAIPEIAKTAGHLFVFQRTPNFSVPAKNAALTPDYVASWKNDYPALRRRAREETRSGTIYEFATKSAHAATEEEREAEYQRRWDKGGANFMHAYNDLVVDEAANRTAAEFVHRKIREIVKDTRTADLLSPKDYPIFTKRICVDTDYYATFNRPNVTLVDIRTDPIEAITPGGIRTAGGHYDLDVLIYATGFDAMTGALNRIDIRGRDGRDLRSKWAHGPRAYLGLMSAGFPNLFMVTGPGSPSVLSNVITSIEQHVEFITDCIAHMRKKARAEIEPEAAAEDAWVAHVGEVAAGTLLTKAASWYMGANIPGKPRVFMPYVGGVDRYRRTCNEIVAKGYQGFVFA